MIHQKSVNVCHTRPGYARGNYTATYPYAPNRELPGHQALAPTHSAIRSVRGTGLKGPAIIETTAEVHRT